MPYTVEIHVQALRNTFGLVDHYFLIIGDWEYHMGYYPKGSVIPRGTTKGSHCTEIKQLCNDCFLKLEMIYNLKEDKRMFGLYPLINCETMCMGISIQALGLTIVPLITLLLFVKQYSLFLILILLVIVVHYTFSKYNFSKCKKTKCKHLVFDAKNQIS